MKITKLLLLVLSCMLIVGCKKNKSDDPTLPTPQYPTITMDSLKNYFPYQTGDQIIFLSGNIGVTYTIKEATFVSNNNKMNVNINMDGIFTTYGIHFYVQLTAEVTENHLLKATFYEYVESSGQHLYPKEGTYEYDTAKSGELPEKFNYLNGAIVEKNIGLSHFIDGFGDEWNLAR